MKANLNIRALAVAAFFTAACLAAHAEDDAATPASALAAGIAADENPYLPWDKGSVTFGGFIAAFDDSIGFGSDGAAGVTINPEKLLGLESTLTVFRAGALYRPGKTLRNQFDFSYAAYDRSGSGTLSEEILINGNTYPIGAHVDSHLNFDIIRGTYSYAFLQDERMRIAAGLSVYVVPLSYGLTVTTTNVGTAVQGANTTLPLPALALRSEFQLVPKVFLNGSIDAMYLEISQFTGYIEDIGVGLEYKPWKHFGVGLDYNYMSAEVKAESSGSSYPGANFIGSVNIRFTGLMLSGKFTF